MVQQQRPTGITVLAILAFIGGVLGILAGLALFGASSVFGGGAAIFGLVALILGILDLVLGYGFWTLKPWAWTLGIALEVIGIIEAIFYIARSYNTGGEVVDILIAAIVIYYLTRPNVRQAFGRA